MDAKELERMMAVWKRQKEQLDLLETTITAEILKREKSFEVEGVKAAFRKGARKFDYAFISDKAEPALVEKHTKVVEKTDWAKVCKELKITDIPFTQADPTVSLKLITKEK